MTNLFSDAVCENRESPLNFDLRGLIVDAFCGGGGASTGIEWALGRSPDYAINHDDAALAMHTANHPDTIHLKENVWKVDPYSMIDGREVSILWASPDCRHFSKASNSAPVSKSVRSLADVVILWAKVARPAMIFVENVEEFQDWGPLTPEGRPCRDRKGSDFKRWIGALRQQGYRVDWKILRACDYGAPTIRKRLFVVARRDRKPIVWPAPTHGDPRKFGAEIAAGQLKPWRTTAEIIDWSLSCPSIFMTRAEAKALDLQVVRPLADKTMARIARGFKRFVLDRPAPFILSYYGEGAGGLDRSADVHAPLRTVTTENRFAMVSPRVAPFVSYGQQGSASHRLMLDQTKSFVVVANHGGEGFRGQGIDAPFATVTAARDAFGLVTPHLMTMRDARKPFMVDGALAPFVSYGQQGGASRPIDTPHHTICASSKDQNQLVAAALAPWIGVHRHDSSGQPINNPLPTITANSFVKRPGAGGPLSVVTAYMAQHNGGERAPVGRAMDEPVSTLMTVGAQQQPVVAYLAPQQGLSSGADVEAPLGTVLAQGQHHSVILSYLTAYYGTHNVAGCDEPMRTATAKDRFGLVESLAEAPPLDAVKIASARKVACFLREQGVWDCNPDGSREFVIVSGMVVWDIGMRMLRPVELARAQGFDANYELAPIFNGKPLSETAQRNKIGNSVSPNVAEALIKANAIDALEMPDVARKRREKPVHVFPACSAPVEPPSLLAWKPKRASRRAPAAMLQ